MADQALPAPETMNEEAPEQVPESALQEEQGEAAEEQPSTETAAAAEGAPPPPPPAAAAAAAADGTGAQEAADADDTTAAAVVVEPAAAAAAADTPAEPEPPAAAEPIPAAAAAPATEQEEQLEQQQSRQEAQEALSTPVEEEQPHSAAAAAVTEQEEEKKQAEEVERPQRPQQHGPAAAATTHHTTHHVPAAAAGSLRATTPCAGASAKGLTFSRPPHTVKAKPYKRIDYSHSAVELLKIGHDNELLVHHLTTISKAVPSWKKDADAPPAPGNTASSAVNRRKQAAVIAQENHALYQRLVSIRPSKDISRETLDFAHRQHETYRANCAQFKPASPRKAAGAAPQ